MKRKLLILALALGVVAATPAMSDSWMPVRSDLPFWAETDAHVWPRAEADGMGQASILPLGDWHAVEDDCNECEPWYRLSIAGIIDGGFLLVGAPTKEALDQERGDSTLLKDLGAVTYKGASGRLFAFEVGLWGGSSYLVVFAQQTHGNLFDKLTVLDLRCPASEGDGYEVRQWAKRSVYRTAYCAVDDQAALKRLARKALRREPRGVLQWAGDPVTESQP